ncbi:MAG: amine oxidase [Thermoleophilia bacterium]|nr:amine oxidase [Thermoleophilia bacterium]
MDLPLSEPSVEPPLPRVAIIGSGITGLAAAWRLRGDCDVTLFEEATRLGGHANTRDVIDSTGATVPVDTGFIVHNRRTYPYLLALLEELDVPTIETEMSLAVECRECGIQYAGRRPASLLIGALRRPRLLGLLVQVGRFMRRATRELESGIDDHETLREWSRRHRFGRTFETHFLLPLTASVWSAPPGTALDMPAGFILAFLDNHGMLSTARLPWRTIEGGSRTYVDRLVRGLVAAGADVRRGTPVTSIEQSSEGRVSVFTADSVERFDAVLVATHADAALALLTAPTPLQRELLGSWTYTENTVELHDDESELPTQHSARASWNYRLETCTGHGSVPTVSYDLTRLQALDTPQRWIVTLNGPGVDPERVAYATTYRHPQLDVRAVEAQRRMHELDVEALDTRISFAGAWRGYGFHEDGAREGTRAAERLLSAIAAAATPAASAEPTHA